MNKKALLTAAVAGMLLTTTAAYAMGEKPADDTSAKTKQHKDGCNGKDSCKSKDKAKDGCSSKDGCESKDSCKSKDKSKDA